MRVHQISEKYIENIYKITHIWKIKNIFNQNLQFKQNATILLKCQKSSVVLKKKYFREKHIYIYTYRIAQSIIITAGILDFFVKERTTLQKRIYEITIVNVSR